LSQVESDQQKQNLLDLLNADAALEDFTTLLKLSKEAGKSGDEVYALLQSLRSEVLSEKQEDRILELMDVCLGFCSPQQRIW
jgi:hypothetical protein